MSNYQILVVDDEADIRELLHITLDQFGLEVHQAGSLGAALAQLEAQRFDLCLTDMLLPDGNGLELVDHIQRHCPAMPVAIITAHGNTELAVESFKKGVFDFVAKPVELARLRAMVQAALQLCEESPLRDADKTGLTGASPVMGHLRRQIAQVARSQAPIFITGESGTGKELVARAIHCLSPRSQGPFIPVNCGAIPAELMESEFFGHKKGSFSGAFQDKQGLFQAAHGGTLLLDEVADLPQHMQVKLLRAIQEKSVRPIGDPQEKSIDVRILSTSHKDLDHEVRAGRFREDLFYRINVIAIRVPALRERKQDIPLLAQLFLAGFSRETGLPAPQLSGPAEQALFGYSFPGNVRELENILQRAFTLSADNVITPHDLNLQDRQAPPPVALARGSGSVANDYVPGCGVSLDDFLADVEREILLRVLEDNRWNKTRSAAKLGLSFRQLRYKLQKLAIN